MDYKEQKTDQIKLSARAEGEDPWSDAIANYEILERLGEGSITTVYKVRREGIDEIFAAKVLRSQFADNPRTAKRFALESKKATALNQAHLVSVYETGNTASGLPYLICDFVDGGNLDERLAEGGRMSRASVFDLFLALCEGLELAHSKNIIHRDIKPGNIVFKRDGDRELPKLADFGIAKVLPSAGRETKYFTPEGDAFGNPAYMSPEQLEGKRLDARSDIYALGCVMYQCLCGHPPFEGKNAVQIALKQLQTDPDFEHWRRLGIMVDADVQLIVSGMMAKSPADRYQSVAALAADLRCVKNGGRAKYKAPPLKPVPAVETSSAPRPTSPKVEMAEQVEEKSNRSAIVFNTSLAKHSLEISEPVERNATERAALNGSGIVVNGRPLGAKATIAIAATACVLVGLAAGFCINMAGSAGPDLNPQVSAAGVTVRDKAYSDRLFIASPQTRGAVSTFSDPGPKYYSLTESANTGSLTDQMHEPLLTKGGRVIFWYNPDYLREALSDAAKHGVDMSSAELSHSDLRNARLTNARLHGADLRNCRLEGAILVGADLGDADMSGSTLPSTEFDGL